MLGNSRAGRFSPSFFVLTTEPSKPARRKVSGWSSPPGGRTAGSFELQFRNLPTDADGIQSILLAALGAKALVLMRYIFGPNWRLCKWTRSDPLRIPETRLDHVRAAGMDFALKSISSSGRRDITALPALREKQAIPRRAFLPLPLNP